MNTSKQMFILGITTLLVLALLTLLRIRQ